MVRAAKLFIFIVTIALTAIAAHADALLDKVIPNGPVCFARDYDAAHLKAQPKQRVTSFRLDFYPADVEQGKARQRYDFHAAVGARNPGTKMRSLGGCFTDDGVFGCKLECDIGRFGIKPFQNGLEVTVETIALDGCGESDNELGGPADRVIRLRRLPDAACKSADDWAQTTD